jgi:TolB-like protein
MTMTPVSLGEAPTPDELRAAIDRIATSEVFVRSPQLGAFLRFVCEAVLRGKADRIKAYTIGVEVLRRDTNFDPQIDPIVRVEATRLRRALERYYAGPGVNDPVTIDLPRGSYVPVFRTRGVEAEAVPRRMRWRGLRAGRSRIAAGLGAGIVAAALVGLAIFGGGGIGPWFGSQAAFTPMTGTPRPGNGMPVLLVQKLEGHGRSDFETAMQAALFDAMQGQFSRFDTINVRYPSAAAAGASSRAAARDRDIDYRLIGMTELRADRALNVQFRLLDNASGEVAWSGRFQRTAAAADPNAARDKIVIELATKLFQPFGVIRSHQRTRHLVSKAGDPRYRCIVEASESLRSFDPAQHLRARSCLEQLTASHPDFYIGFSYLAAIYFREGQYGLGARAGDSPPLDRALRAARHAIELKPESARAYQILFTVLFARRDIAEAFAAGDKAMALNPADMTIVSDYGGRLISVGDIERGMRLLQHAAEHGSIRPSWYHFYLFLGYYLGGDNAKAAFEADQITTPGYSFGYVARALAAGAQGNRAQASKEIARLVELQPAWRDDPRRQLEKSIPKAEIVDRLARDLAALGLSGGS